MKNRGLLVIGSVFVLLGVINLVEVIFKVDFGAYFWPLVLIGLGVWLLLRPRLEIHGQFRFIGDVHRSGVWQVTDEQHTVFVGDTRLDFSQAVIPEGETRLVLNGFVGETRIIVPRDLGLTLTCSGFFQSVNWFGDRQENFLSAYEASTPGYEQAPHRLRIEVNYFVSNLRLKYPD